MRVTEQIVRTVQDTVSRIACDGCAKHAQSSVPKDWYTIASGKMRDDMHCCSDACVLLCFGVESPADAARDGEG